jgi:4-amino-4-deoxy-L-arabinose transferase-like glycosyltransferase
MENQQSTGETQNSQKKKWYKSGWGLVVAILLWPYFLLWYMWAKTNWSKGIKISITLVFAFINIIALSSNAPKTDEIKTPEKQQVEVAKAEQTEKQEEAKLSSDEKIFNLYQKIFKNSNRRVK